MIACGTVRLRVHQTDNLGNVGISSWSCYDESRKRYIEKEIIWKKVTSSVLVVDTSEKKESLRPRVLPFPPPTLFCNSLKKDRNVTMITIAMTTMMICVIFAISMIMNSVVKIYPLFANAIMGGY